MLFSCVFCITPAGGSCGRKRKQTATSEPHTPREVAANDVATIRRDKRKMKFRCRIGTDGPACLDALMNVVCGDLKNEKKHWLRKPAPHACIGVLRAG
jgi:hypothetical protein